MEMAMTQEEKQLLLQDICGRLPYGVITKNCKNNFDVPAHLLPDVIGIKLLIDEYDLKPYLRPMSSLAEEEKMELYTRAYAPDEIKTLDEKLYVIQTNAKNAADFYNEHHFDYRGLIEKGLALEAPKDMYKNI